MIFNKRVGLLKEYNQIKVKHKGLDNWKSAIILKGPVEWVSINPINSKDFYLGPYHNELTASRPICAVKHCRAESVVRWGTTCEYSGAPGIFLFTFCVKVQ